MFFCLLSFLKFNNQNEKKLNFHHHIEHRTECLPSSFIDIPFELNFIHSQLTQSPSHWNKTIHQKEVRNFGW